MTMAIIQCPDKGNCHQAAHAGYPEYHVRICVRIGARAVVEVGDGVACAADDVVDGRLGAA